MVEVVVQVGRRLDEGQANTLAEVSLGLDFLGQGRHAQRNVPERTGIPRAFGVEEGQLAAARVGPDECEVVLAVDDVHAVAAGERVGDGLTVGEPERNMIQCLGLHVGDPSYALLPCVDRPL